MDVRDIDDNKWDEEESHKSRSQDSNGKLRSKTDRRHAEVECEAPEKESAAVGEVRAELDFEGEVDHGEED